MERLPHRLTSDGIELATWTWPGARPQFLLVHGLASNARLWDEVADQLATAGYGVHSVDLRGHGRSDRPSAGYDFATLTTDLSEVIRQLGIAPVVAIGQSFGGNLCLELAAIEPHLVSSLALIDGGFIDLSVTFPDWAAAEAALTPPPLPLVDFASATRQAEARFQGFSARGVAAQLANLEPDGDGRIRRRLPLSAHLEILRHLYQHRPLQRAPSVTQPVLIVAADNQDSSDKQQRVGALVAALPQAEAHWIAGHHDLHAQQPETVAKLIIQAVERGFLR
ncbi:MAG TPA: alpha/beta hydrolase [Acidimicrobiia bacterium]|nr:alpha/beta hydrolase [Acidimicrobiia bacterium]